ncbi:MAG TPA: CpsD/CapB family tyrosine-protein kinase [Pirellulales bacterium]|nr:CpsD/CapB family tyrosine-protein kinase [Pirellulales bacterium]
MSSPVSAIVGQNGLQEEPGAQRKPIDEYELAPQSGRRLGRSFHSTGDEHFTAMLRGLPWPSVDGDKPLKTLGLTSCQSGEGVSTVAARLAVRAAELSDRSVLLVDANLARPAIERLFELPRGVGFSDVLLENCDLSAAIRSTHAARLCVLTAGQRAVHPDEVNDPVRMAAMVAALKEDFELVIFDLPPAGEVVSAACLAGLLDGVVLVVEAHRTCWEAAQRVTQQLSRSHARLLGAVLNKPL